MRIELFLIRHAAALPATEGQSDAERPLSERGRRRFERCVQGLVERGVSFDRILHSPLLRAVETAELCAPLLDGKTAVCAGLTGSPSEHLLTQLALHEDERVAVIGHEPWLGELCALCLTGTVERGGAFAFKKGGLAWLVGRPAMGACKLRGFFAPRDLRRR